MEGKSIGGEDKGEDGSGGEARSILLAMDILRECGCEEGMLAPVAGLREGNGGGAGCQACSHKECGNVLDIQE